MIYTYYFTNKFFEDMRNNINDLQILNIIDFIKINFQSKENLHYCGSEEIFEKNFGVNGNNSQILDHFINNFFSVSAVSNFLCKENKADIIFCGNSEEIKKNTIKINCNKILNDESLNDKIEKKTEDDWTNDNGKEDLNKKFNQLLKFSKSIIFVDRHVPACVADNIAIQLEQWRVSLEFYNSLMKYNKINSIFINGINQKIIEKYKNKIKFQKPAEISEFIEKLEILKKFQSDAKKNKKPFNKYIEIENCEKKIENKGEEFLKRDLKEFFKPLNESKTRIMIKNKDAWRELHDRYIFFFFEEFDIERDTFEEFVRDKNLNLFEVSEGLNILDTKKKTTSNRKIIRQKNRISAQIAKKWDKKVNKYSHFYKFTAITDKKAS